MRQAIFLGCLALATAGCHLWGNQSVAVILALVLGLRASDALHHKSWQEQNKIVQDYERMFAQADTLMRATLGGWAEALAEVRRLRGTITRERVGRN